MGLRPPFETFKGAICKGCYALGSACGTCEKCAWERSRTLVEGAKMWTKDAPTKEGYYWWRFEHEASSGEARIVRIFRTILGLKMSFIGTEFVENPGSTPGEFWSEPIAGPEEQTGVVKS